ncbi:MAG: hypothetical protein ACHQ4H_09385 [Ktedonobacterales bacterium]
MTGTRPATAGAGFELPALPTHGASAVLSAPSTPDAAAAARRSHPTARAAKMPAVRLQSPGSFPPDHGPEPARAPTLTAQMRAIQPPDVAKQALSELSVLSRELIALPALLEASGLARTNRRSYFDTTQAFVGLARLAWESVAEERLEQSGAEPDYRQQAIAVARRVSQLQHECRTLSANTTFQLPRKTPAQWRRRTRLTRRGLNAFQQTVSATPDPRAMGRGLFALRGYVGLAAAGRLELTLFGMLLRTTLTLLVLFGLGGALGIGAALAGPGVVSSQAIAVELAICFAGIFTALLGSRGALPLDLLLGAAVFSVTRSTRNVAPGSPLLARLLRAWWVAVSVVGLLATLAALVLGIRAAVLSLPVSAPTEPVGATRLAASVLMLSCGAAAVVSTAVFGVFALPVYLATLLRSSAELAGSTSWVAAARRYALAPALGALVPITAVLAVGVWLLATAAGWQQQILVGVVADQLNVSLSLRGLALFLTFAVPYLLLVDLPFRSGMRRWRHGWIRDLSARRADVESHVRRLSVPDVESGTQDTSEENLRAMQYDLVLLQFYQSKLHEVRHTSNAPFALPALIFALLVFVAVAVLLDSATAVSPLTAGLPSLLGQFIVAG